MESSFCKRNRELQKDSSPWAVDPNTVSSSGASLSLELKNTHNPLEVLSLTITAYTKHTVRVFVNERSPKHARHVVQGVLEPLTESTLSYTKHEGDIRVHFGDSEDSLVIGTHPFRLDFARKDKILIGANDRGLFNFETYKDKAEGEVWEETFKSHRDSRHLGPASVGLDVTFFGAEHVYGIPEHASAHSLKSTKDTDPFRMYNLDVFEYELDTTMTLYGNIPFMVAHSPDSTVGMLFLNSAEMWVDVEHATAGNAAQSILRKLKSLFNKDEHHDSSQPATHTHWFAEAGVLDLFFLLGPSPKDVFLQYASLTGFPALPPLFSLAYHQCRWNYNDEQDVLNVVKNFDEHDMPVDVVWLDIEHTDGKRYFTWDTGKFPHPEQMQKTLQATGRRMVNIVDPHIKRVGGYHIHDQASALGYYIKNSEGSDYDGWCWPGSSSWLDFTNPEISSWWADQFALDKYKGTTESMFIWNDMNEPSVFNGPEVTMHKDAKHFGGWEHRDVHNIYGSLQHAATAEGLVRRSGGVERPFVLSRAFFAGSQRYGAIWTGDNKADWSHMAASIPMILSVGVGGLPFAGADIGGFFGNPEKELLVRWYQLGSFQPFMRGHAHLDTRRREPYLVEQPERDYIRESIRRRYVYLPLWYTLFHEANTTGLPVMRPLWMEYPKEKEVFAEEESFLVGNALLVAPALRLGAQSVNVYFPGPDPWYDVENFKIHSGSTRETVAAPLRKIPVFQRGGSIVPQKTRVRRSSSLTYNDPFTLVAALDNHGHAEGSLYADDYHSFSFLKGDFLLRRFTLTQEAKDGSRYSFRSFNGATNGKRASKEWIERVRILGFPRPPTSVLSSSGARLDFDYNAKSLVLDVKKPTANVAQDFSFVISV